MAYPSDLSDKQWDLIKSHFDTGNYGKKRKHSKRELSNAVFYLIKTGCQWRFLPEEYPPWKSVYSFYMRKTKRNLGENDEGSCLKTANPFSSMLYFCGKFMDLPRF